MEEKNGAKGAVKLEEVAAEQGTAVVAEKAKAEVAVATAASSATEAGQYAYTCRYHLLSGMPCSFGVRFPDEIAEIIRRGDKITIPAMSVVYGRDGKPVRVAKDGEESVVWICHVHVGQLRQSLAGRLQKQERLSPDEAWRRTQSAFDGLGRYMARQRRIEEERRAADTAVDFLFGTGSPSPSPAPATSQIDPSAAPQPQKEGGRRTQGKRPSQRGGRPYSGPRDDRDRGRFKGKGGTQPPKPEKRAVADAMVDAPAEDAKVIPLEPDPKPAPAKATMGAILAARGGDFSALKV